MITELYLRHGLGQSEGDVSVVPDAAARRGAAGHAGCPSTAVQRGAGAAHHGISRAEPPVVGLLRGPMPRGDGVTSRGSDVCRFERTVVPGDAEAPGLGVCPLLPPGATRSDARVPALQGVRSLR